MKITIDIESMFKSTLTPDQYLLLLLILKKEFKSAERLVLSLFGYSYSSPGEIYLLLEDEGFLKINGPKVPDDCIIRQKFLNLLTEAETLTVDVSSWIDDYRNLFKNTRPGAMGDKNACITKMQRFLSSYEYSKEDVLKAAKYYVSTCAKDNYKYITNADYLISKEDAAGNITCKLLPFIEETKSESFVETGDFTKSI
jgi:hypothetical protein